MTTIKNRKSVLAIVKETSEGTLKLPAAGTDYIALQDGFDFEPAFETLENAELQPSIGKAKSIIGSESPNISISHYLRHSGVEGQAPNFGDLIESCLGATTVQAAERTLAAGSTAGDDTTRAVLALAAGGADYARGTAVMIKDGVNGFSIRPVFSVATDDLSLGFNLASAPAIGVICGKFVNYSVSDDGHPTVSGILYRGNGGVIEAEAGGRVTEMSIEANAGEMVNASFTLPGIEYFFNPIEITAANEKIDFTDGVGAVVGNVARKIYKDPHELAVAISTAMTAASVGSDDDTITVTYSDVTGKYTVASSGTVFTIVWTAANHIGATIGFTANDSGALTYTGDEAIDLAAAFTPVFDGADPIVAKNGQIMLGDFKDYACFNCDTLAFTVSGTKKDLLSICAESGKSGSMFTGRDVSVAITAYLNQYDVDKFKRFRTGQDTAFCANFGTKSGGNWIPGRCVSIYMPTTSITEFKISDDEGLAKLEITLSGYIAAGAGEFYINFL